MPRNDQITRQWHLLRRLEGSNGLTLDELVESVPDDYPKTAARFGVTLKPWKLSGFHSSPNTATARRAGGSSKGFAIFRRWDFPPLSLWH